MQAPDWNDYHVFFAIAREGQLMRAAERLGIDATTAGRRLRRLEARLGRTLFEQTREGQVLTEAGEALLTHVEAMAFAAMNIGTHDQNLEGPVGTLRISVSEGFGSWFLARRLPEFAALYPHITIDLVASSSFLSLSKREADVAIFLSRPKAGPLIAKKLAPYRLRFYASREYIARNGTPSSTDDLRAHRLIGYIPDLLSAPELRYSEEAHPDVPVTLRSSSINAQFSMIMAGGGVGVLPCFIGDTARQLVRVVPDVFLERQFWLVMHKDTQQLSKVKVFKTWIQGALDAGGSRHLLGTA